MNELTKREFIATEFMKALLTKYSLNNPQDQQTISQLSVELTDALLNELN